MKYLQYLLLAVLLLFAAAWFLVWLPPVVIVLGLLFTLACGLEMLRSL